MTQRYGTFRWACPTCGKEFVKDTPQGLGLAKENHWRIHFVRDEPCETEYILDDTEVR